MKFNKFALILMLFTSFLPAFGQKMKAEDVIKKHLDSIGTAEARKSAGNRIAVGGGTVRFISQKNAETPGRLVLASSGGSNYLGMNFNAADYPLEKFSFDGSKAKVSFVRIGTRSVLGNFVLSNSQLLEESLLGGALSTSWALLNADGKKAKISYEGTKKIDGKEVYVLGYSPKNGSDIDIKLYFDKETFRHVRTEYKRTASAGIGTRPEQSSGYIETRYKVTEDFGDFKTTNNVVLPHNYRLNYSVSGQNGTTEIEWKFDLTEFAFNQTFTAGSFDAEAK